MLSNSRTLVVQCCRLLVILNERSLRSEGPERAARCVASFATQKKTRVWPASLQNAPSPALPQSEREEVYLSSARTVALTTLNIIV